MSAKLSGLQTVVSGATQPVAQSGQQTLEGLRGSVEWYWEKWEDVVHEARAERAGAARTPSDVLGNLAEARIVSNVPGRVRFRVPSVKGNDRIARQCEQALAGMPGITRAEVNSLTCSILIYFDKAQFPSVESLVQTVAAG